jgi:hypothetical protein
MACGFMARSEGQVSAWQPKDDFVDGNDDPVLLEICPGYTTELPDVVDVARAYLHWDKGQLGIATGDVDLPAALLDGIELLSSAYSAHQAAKIEEQRNGTK